MALATPVNPPPTTQIEAEQEGVIIQDYSAVTVDRCARPTTEHTDFIAPLDVLTRRTIWK